MGLRQISGFLAIASLACCLSACSHQSADAMEAKHDGEVHVALTDAGCTPKAMTLTAGPHTFIVSNAGAASVTEFELLDKERIIGEAENLTPGLRGKFTLNLRTGEYHTHCPGGTASDGAVSVVGQNTDGLSKEASAAVAAYRSYLIAQTALLSERSNRFIAAVERGDRNEAKSLYAQTRIPYERIEPVAEQFPDLDKAIDARANDVPKASWSGYHRIEYILWTGRPMAEARPYAAQLRKQIAQLRARVATLPLDPAQIANGSVSLLDEIAKTKVTGEEERYSHTDLSDFRANVDGAQAAYRALAPLLHKYDPQLAQTLNTRFQELHTKLARYASGDGYLAYTSLNQHDVRELTASVDALAEPLSQVAGRVVQHNA